MIVLPSKGHTNRECGVNIMKVRLGFVALVLGLDKVTTSSTLTYARYKKMVSEEKKLNELKRVTLSNVEDLYTILEYCLQTEVEFYRITSKLIPLATHPDVMWNWQKYFQIEFKRIGDLVKKFKMRVDTHPDQFDVINTIRPEVLEKTKIDFQLHHEIFEMMGLDNQYAKMVTHVGSGQGGKEEAKKRFIRQYKTIDEPVRRRLILENDDKVFTIKDVVDIYEEVGIPIVLDIHHHRCNPSSENIESFLPAIIESWDKEIWCPKVHLSSPRVGEKDQRKHADYIDVEDLIPLVELFKLKDQDVDIMLECKKKELALFKLIEDAKEVKPEWNWVTPTTFEL